MFFSPATSVLNVYDVYSVSKDERDMGSITKDKYLQTKIRSKILFTKGLSSFDIEVEVFYGDVFLLGLVDTKELEEMLVKLAVDTDGVRSVNTYIKIKQASYPCSSLAILTNLKQNLFTDSVVDGTNVRVAVVGCDVVFSGVVNSIEQEKHAIWYATHIEGVKSVQSFLRVTSRK
ncbi:putative periplasmic chaperone OsmY (BON domain) [Campylobacter mucosalis]|uniref:BON domain-containing protein n=1 Tax=Campylobacter mucosalis TaxID=202 RepID=UPI000689C2B8|nr:BON domain-containing protein [Campylobacter mucosalis]QKF62403.1 putative periplasmic chaperone OsmY (BON domain) [Campylobacter mucosalis]